MKGEKRRERMGNLTRLSGTQQQEFDFIFGLLLVILQLLVNLLRLLINLALTAAHCVLSLLFGEKKQKSTSTKN